MPVFIGQFLLTGELLNKVAAPLIKNRCRFLHEISFRIVDDFVTAEISGRYSLLGFKGYLAVHLLEFLFGRSVYRIDLRLSVDLWPRFLKPLIAHLLKRKLSRLSGVSWTGNRIHLEPAKMPFFSQIEKTPPWGELFSLLEITRDDRDGRGLLFNLYLSEPYQNDNRRDQGKD